MIRYASESGINTHMYSNLLMLNNGVKIQALVSSGLDRLTVSIDGVTQQTYEKYRVGGDLDSLFNIVSELVEAKRRSCNPSLKIVGQMVFTRQNEHEIDLFKQRALSLGLDYVVLKTASLGLTKRVGDHMIDSEVVKSFLPSLKEFRRYKNTEQNIRNGCSWLYKECAIYWNGDVTTCCHDPSGVNMMGNVFDEGSLWSVWNGSKYRLLRQQVNDDIRLAEPLCSNCPDRVVIGES